MDIRVEKDGVVFTVECKNAAELETAIRVLSESFSDSSKSPVRASARARALSRPKDHYDQAREFLTIVSGHGDGIFSHDIAQKMDLSHTKALGPLTTKLNKLLDEAKLKKDSVYTSKKAFKEPRKYFPGKKVHEALVRIEELELQEKL